MDTRKSAVGRGAWLFSLALILDLFASYAIAPYGLTIAFGFLSLPLVLPILLVLWNETQTNQPTNKIGMFVMSAATFVMLILAGYTAFS